jgi:type I restriction enzyme R subunit
MHDFVLFDGGVKKLPRVHQYFGIKAAQEHVRQRKGGIIWHTQGSGKSIVMVLLAKWILENNPHARVVPSSPTATSWTSRSKRVFPMPARRFTAPAAARPDGAVGAGQAAPAVLAGAQVRPHAMSDRLRGLHPGLEAQPSRPWASCSCSSMNATAPRAASCTG